MLRPVKLEVTIPKSALSWYCVSNCSILIIDAMHEASLIGPSAEITVESNP